LHDTNFTLVWFPCWISTAPFPTSYRPCSLPKSAHFTTPQVHTCNTHFFYYKGDIIMPDASSVRRNIFLKPIIHKAVSLSISAVRHKLSESQVTEAHPTPPLPTIMNVVFHRKEKGTYSSSIFNYRGLIGGTYTHTHTPPRGK
jgi:hypothetical protein